MLTSIIRIKECPDLELAKLLDTALFTVLTPQARQNAEAKALKFREEWEGKLEEHLIGKFKEKKKDRRRN